MPSQKLPLFNGIIQPIPLGTTESPETTTVFSKPYVAAAPRTYEVHLWMLPPPEEPAPFTLTVMASEGPLETATKSAAVWRGRTVEGSFPNGGRAIKILDGFAVRGNVELAILCSTPDSEDYDYPINCPQVFGYYYQVGAGSDLDLEHRIIGNDTLEGFNQGVPFSFVVPATPTPSTSQIIHVFESGRIDEISLALSVAEDSGEVEGVYGASLTFEDVNNQPLIEGHAVPIVLTDVLSSLAFSAANTLVGQPGQQNVLSSPYVFKNIPFGGNPLLHHLRLNFAAGAGGPGVATAHGYYIRH